MSGASSCLQELHAGRRVVSQEDRNRNRRGVDNRSRRGGQQKPLQPQERARLEQARACDRHVGEGAHDFDRGL